MRTSRTTSAINNSQLNSISELGVEAFPIMAFLRKYRRELHEQTESLRLSHWDDSIRVRLEDVYVEPLVKAKRKSQWLAGVLDLPRVSRGSVVTGDPGAGKTTMLRYLQHRLSLDQPDLPDTPLYVPLIDYNRSLQSGRVSSLSDYLEMQARSLMGFQEIPDHFFEYLLRCLPSVVMFDGLDEIGSVDERRKMRDAIEAFQRNCPAARVIATAREVGYSLASLGEDGFCQFQMTPFSDEQVARYAQAWFKVRDPQESETLAAKFIDQVKTVDLRPNPLALSLMCAVFSVERDLPPTRAQLYEKCTELFMQKWDAMRGVQVPRVVEVPDLVLASIAHELMTRMSSGGNDDLEIGRDDLIDLVASVVLRYVGRKDIALRDAKEFVDVVSGRMWILGTADGRTFFFTHRTFLEYFIARHLVETYEQAASLWMAIKKLVNTGAWQVVTELAAQLYALNRDTWGDKLVEEALEPGLAGDLLEYVLSMPGFLTLTYRTVGKIIETGVVAFARGDKDRSVLERRLRELAAGRYRELCLEVIAGAIAQGTGSVPDLVALARRVSAGDSLVVLSTWIHSNSYGHLAAKGAESRSLAVKDLAAVSLPLAFSAVLSDPKAPDAGDYEALLTGVVRALASDDPALASQGENALAQISRCEEVEMAEWAEEMLSRRLNIPPHPLPQRSDGEPKTLRPAEIFALWAFSETWLKSVAGTSSWELASIWARYWGRGKDTLERLRETGMQMGDDMTGSLQAAFGTTLASAICQIVSREKREPRRVVSAEAHSGPTSARNRLRATSGASLSELEKTAEVRTLAKIGKAKGAISIDEIEGALSDFDLTCTETAYVCAKLHAAGANPPQIVDAPGERQRAGRHEVERVLGRPLRLIRTAGQSRYLEGTGAVSRLHESGFLIAVTLEDGRGVELLYDYLAVANGDVLLLEANDLH